MTPMTWIFEKKMEAAQGCRVFFQRFVKCKHLDSFDKNWIKISELSLKMHSTHRIYLTKKLHNATNSLYLSSKHTSRKGCPRWGTRGGIERPRSFKRLLTGTAPSCSTKDVGPCMSLNHLVLHPFTHQTARYTRAFDTQGMKGKWTPEQHRRQPLTYLQLFKCNRACFSRSGLSSTRELVITTLQSCTGALTYGVGVHRLMQLSTKHLYDCINISNDTITNLLYKLFSCSVKVSPWRLR